MGRYRTTPPLQQPVSGAREKRTTGLGSGTARTAGWAALGCLVAAACTSGDTTAGPAATTTAPAASGTAVATSGDFAGMIDIGGGRTMYLECSGTGSPSVVLIAGVGGAGDSWRYAFPVADKAYSAVDDAANPPTQNNSAVYPTTESFTRVCTYDRPGTMLLDGAAGRSSAGPQPTTVEGDAADLHTLLTAAEVPGPYVFVGHSLGGWIATTYARTFPSEVTGLVLVDPASEYLKTTLGTDAFQQWTNVFLGRLQTDPGVEAPNMLASAAAIDPLPPVPSIPAAVLTADQPWFAFPTDEGLHDYWTQWLEAQNLLAASLRATHITQTNSDHSIYLRNPAVVNKQICAVIMPGTNC